MTFGFCKNPSPKLCDYSTRTGSWLPALAATTNQPFGMHLKHVHVPASSPCLLPLLGSKFLLTPKEESDFDLGLRKKVPFVQCHLTNLLATYLWYNLLEVFSLYFTCNLMWYICVTPCPTKRNVMSSSRSTPRIDDLFDHLSRAKVFSRINLRSGYY